MGTDLCICEHSHIVDKYPGYVWEMCQEKNCICKHYKAQDYEPSAT